MTNEELVERIQMGDDGLYPQLWDQVRKFIAMRAKRCYRLMEGKKHGCEIDDLINAGYFAVVNAAQRYTRFSGAKFITYLDYHLRNAFHEALGLRGNRIRALDLCESLDRITDFSDGNGRDQYDTVTIPDACCMEELVTESVYNQELRAVLDKALEILPVEQRQTVILHYFFCIDHAEIAAFRNVSEQAVSSAIKSALIRIYNGKFRGRLASFLYDDGFNPFCGCGTGNKALCPDSSSVEERYITEKKRLLALEEE